MPNKIKRWLDDILYKRARASHADVLMSQILKGAEKYENPLPGNWSAKELVHHAKMENVDQFIYLEALEMVIEKMNEENEQLKQALAEVQERAEIAENELANAIIEFDRQRRRLAHTGR